MVHHFIFTRLTRQTIVNCYHQMFLCHYTFYQLKWIFISSQTSFLHFQSFFHFHPFSIMKISTILTIPIILSLVNFIHCYERCGKLSIFWPFPSFRFSFFPYFSDFCKNIDSLSFSKFSIVNLKGWHLVEKKVANQSFNCCLTSLSDCGRTGIQRRVFGGNETYHNQYPWMAHLRWEYREINLSFSTKGSFISLITPSCSVGAKNVKGELWVKELMKFGTLKQNFQSHFWIWIIILIMFFAAFQVHF